MGRAIKKSHFGALTQDGFQITVNAKFDSGSPEVAIIVSQRGTRKYKCKSIANPSKILDCFLVDGPAPTTIGTACLPVISAAGTEYARTLYQYTVKTYAGNNYKWDADGRGDVVIGIGSGGNDVPVVPITALVDDYTVTAGNEAAPTVDEILVVADGGSGYTAGTYTDATVTGYTGITAPSISYVVGVGGSVTSVTVTDFGTAVEDDVLSITIPAPAP